jgi:hypothetical protein
MQVHHLVMRKLSWLFLAAFFFLNPGFACGPGEAEYQYGAAEMRAAIEGEWALTITPTGGAAEDYVVTLKQATSATASASGPRTRSLVRAAHACGNRTLFASANACVDSTDMPLTVALGAGSPPVTGTPTASFNVRSLTFTQGELYLTLGERRVTASVKADGTVIRADVSTVAAGPIGTATLRRLP